MASVGSKASLQRPHPHRPNRSIANISIPDIPRHPSRPFVHSLTGSSSFGGMRTCSIVEWMKCEHLLLFSPFFIYLEEYLEMTLESWFFIFNVNILFNLILSKRCIYTFQMFPINSSFDINDVLPEFFL